MMKALKRSTDTFTRIFNKKILFRFLFVSLVIFFSVLVTRIVLERVLVKSALELEADFFIKSYQNNNNFNLPRTRNLIGYLSGDTAHQAPPSNISALSPGLYSNIYFHDAYPKVPVLVKEFNDKRLYLVFLEGNVDRLVAIFGVLPISLVLIIGYFFSWYAYKRSWGAISPVLRLSKKVRGLDPEHAQPLFDQELPKLKGDMADLAHALQDYSRRIEDLIQRERQFTSDSSHELRTPVTIIDGAVQIMLHDPNIQGKSRDRLEMIKRATGDLSELIRVFFLLAREKELKSEEKEYGLAQLVAEEMTKLQPILEESPVKLKVIRSGEWHTKIPFSVFSIILNNLVRNAINYTEQGSVEVRVEDNCIVVKDTGKGIDPDLLPDIFERHVRGRGHSKAGEGLGMAIVKRLIDQFGLKIELYNRQPQGLKIIIKDAGK